VVNQNPTLGNIQVTLESHTEATFNIPDVTKILTRLDLIPVYAESAMLALATKIETDLFNMYAGLNFNAAVGSAGSDLTEDTVDQAETALFNAKVPKGQQLNLVVSGTQYSKLRQIPRFTESQTIGNGAAITSGAMGTIKSFNVYRSQLVATTATPQTYNLAFSRNAIALVSRVLPLALPGQGVIQAVASLPNGLSVRVTMSYNPNSLSQQFTADILYGQAILRNQFGVQVLTR
jgi:hypothetical protein